MQLCNFIGHGCTPVNLLHIFRTPFPKNTSERVLLTNPSVAVNCHVNYNTTHKNEIQVK